ncbi:DNA-binding transcriptional MerR regulator [Caldicoprobacter guelmensis]|uniref:MerR family transcriptional regulator n=1 Tax=Caldicoprobacter guelmensis TaxID=1170224 RepID=UPI0019582DF6|nr:MerR family transcriptional regulator [Caldicoprobacter guelmensis]MBM7581608.1 DNA-binding transcriptional MerR regulator [Caldicoprobacter guelmensis]
MEYTIHELAKLAGITTRALRYYDEIGLLKPARVNSSGYRIYGEAEVDKLQQILFYRELGVSLNDIKEILTSPSFNRVEALKEYRAKLLDEKKRLEKLIANVEKTIAMLEGRVIMTDKEKFEGFKQKMIEENELKYGKEIREKYGDEAVDSSYKKLKNMTEEEYVALEKLSSELNETLKLAFDTGDPAGELAQRACELHKKWLMYFWSSYSKEAHMALVQMYVQDERFKAYYDKIAPGCAEFLRDAMRIYTGIKE